MRCGFHQQQAMGKGISWSKGRLVTGTWIQCNKQDLTDVIVCNHSYPRFWPFFCFSSSWHQIACGHFGNSWFINHCVGPPVKPTVWRRLTTDPLTHAPLNKLTPHFIILLSPSTQLLRKPAHPYLPPDSLVTELLVWCRLRGARGTEPTDPPSSQ